MKIENTITRLLDVKHPIIMAPMFLVSNEKMIHSAIKSGIMGVFPSLNYRGKGELEAILADGFSVASAPVTALFGENGNDLVHEAHRRLSTQTTLGEQKRGEQENSHVLEGGKH